MKRATLWVGVFTLILFGCMPAPAENEGVEEPEDLDVVTMEVGPTSLTQADKLETPIAHVPIGRYFWLEVIWVDPVEELSLTLSTFKTVSFHHPGPPGEEEDSRAFWRWNEDDILDLSDEAGAVSDNEVVLGYWDAVKQSDGRMMTRRKIRFQRNHDRGPDPRRPSLIFFQTTVKVGDEVKFTYDPPWVEKPPTG